MLVQLTISNFAIISQLEIDFKPGLNILSGETGAGKSIIINAVNLILGGRASADLIRSGCREARVEALFRLTENPSVSGLLSDLDFPFDGDLLIKRTLSREGRNRITINDSLATLQALSRVGSTLISISGQHEHQLLLRPDNHLYILDDFGGLAGERSELGQGFEAYQSLRGDLLRLEKEIKESEDKRELTHFQINEIETARITEGEDERLEEEKRWLRHGKQLMEIVQESYEMLYESEDSLLARLAQCIRRIGTGAEINQQFKGIAHGLTSAKAELEEAALELRELQKTIMIDPGRLEQVEERIQSLNRLKRKYGPTLEDVLRSRDQLTLRMDNLDQKRVQRDKIEKELKAMERDILSRAVALSKKRKEVAKRFGKAVENELRLLDMKGTRFEVRFHREGVAPGEDSENGLKAMGADGYDIVEFMLSPNIGEELRPLSRIASGGELSRIMLALKTILARKGSVETLIFDEVDSGIGGATAEVVGEKLNSLAHYHQILCISHLPQIASKGDTHFLVRKTVRGTRTETIISELSGEERVKEIARLLGGKVVTSQAVAHAREMLG